MLEVALGQISSRFADFLSSFLERQTNFTEHRGYWVPALKVASRLLKEIRVYINRPRVIGYNEFKGFLLLYILDSYSDSLLLESLRAVECLELDHTIGRGEFQGAKPLS